MRIYLLFTLLFFSIPLVFAQSPYDGNGVFDLIGQSTTSDGMQKLRRYMSEDPGTKFSETTWFSRKKRTRNWIEIRESSSGICAW